MNPCNYVIKVKGSDSSIGVNICGDGKVITSVAVTQISGGGG